MLFVVYAFLLHTEHFISFTPFSCCGWTIDCGIWRILRFHYSTPLTQFATSTFSCWKFRIEGNLAPIYLRSSHENVYTHVLQKQKVVTMLHEALTAFMKYVYVFRLAGTTVSNDLLCTLRNLHSAVLFTAHTTFVLRHVQTQINSNRIDTYVRKCEYFTVV